MQSIRLRSATRALILAGTLWAFQVAVPVRAQDPDTKVKENKVVVEVRDGIVYVNGEKSEVGEDGQIVIRKGDGNEVVVVTRKDGPFWISAFGDGERALAEAERAHEMARGMMRYRMPRPDGDFFMEFDPPDVEVMDLEGRLADAFENAPFDGDFMRFRRQSDELREKEREIREKSREIRRAESGERAALEAELDALISEAFQLKLRDERKGVEELESRLQELRSRLREREERRTEIIERRKKDLLGRRDNLDW